MTLLHIYDKETGEYMRSQEPTIDPLETQLRGETVYTVYDNSTEDDLPEYDTAHEKPYFVDGAWVVKGKWKNTEVYNTATKTFEHCNDNELNANQVYISDTTGIERFKACPQKYIVNEDFEIVENPKYEQIMELRDVENQISMCEQEYAQALQTPVVFPGNGHVYKPIWIDDGTYVKLITGVTAGLLTFPQTIWDATELAENAVEMSQQDFMQLCGFLAMAQQTAFAKKKQTKDMLLIRKAALEEEISE